MCGMSQVLADGVVICSALPVAPNMVILLTLKAGGDESAAVFNSAFGNIAGVFITPLWVFILLGETTDIDPGPVILKLVYVVITPLLFGQLLQCNFPTIRAFVARHKAHFKAVQEFLLCFIVYFVFCTAFGNKSNISFLSLMGMIFVQVCLLVAANALAWVYLGVLFTDKPRLRVMGIFGCTQKTVAVGVPMMQVMFGVNKRLALYTLPLFIWHPAQLVLGSFLAPHLTRWADKSEAEIATFARCKAKVEADKTDDWSNGALVADDPSHREPCPLVGSTPLARLTYTWVWDLMAKGAAAPLEAADLWDVPPADAAAHLRTHIVVAWQFEQERGKEPGAAPPSFVRSSLRAFAGLGAHRIGLLLPVLSAVRIVQAVTLGRFVTHMASGDRGPATWAYTATLVALGAAGFQLHHGFYFQGWRFGMQMRTGMVAVIHAKAVRLALNAVEIGNVVSLATNDIEKFQVAGWSSHYFWAGPLEALAVLVVGIVELGPAFAAGWALLLALVPIQSSFGRRFGALRSNVAGHTDARMRLTSQAISGARLIKIFAWENMFAESIARIREDELKGVRKASVLRAINESIFFTSLTLIAFTTFVTHGEALPCFLFNHGCTLWKCGSFPFISLLFCLFSSGGQWYSSDTRSPLRRSSSPSASSTPVRCP